jgi:hypothetical protein
MGQQGNGNGRRRLPDRIDERLGEMIARQLRIQGELEAIFKSLDSSTGRHLQSRFQFVMDESERTEAGLRQHSEDLKDLLLELRQRCT